MEFIDYYKLLNVSKDASEQDIKKAFRKLARKFHPDLHPNDPSAKKKFQEINEAHEVLSDPDKRKKYDAYGKDWQHAEQFEKARTQQQRSGANPFGQAASHSQHFSDSDFSSFFESLFGQAPNQTSRTAAFRGQDIQATLQVRLSEIQKTEKRVFEINGKKIRISVPAGVEDGQIIKLNQLGGAGSNGGPNGDLYISFNVINDTNFKRSGDTLFKDVTVDITTAVLGGSTEVETLQGKVKLQINAGTQNGTKARLKGRGFPKYKKENEFGDLIVNIRVQIPTQLSEREKELYTELAKERINAAA